MSSANIELTNTHHDGEANVTETSAQNISDIPITTMWIGYEKYNRHFIDKTRLETSSEHQIKALRAYYHQQFSSLQRFLMVWLLCKVPVIMLGQVGPDTANGIEAHQQFPHQTQFSELTVSEPLTRGFACPETLRDDGNLFVDDAKFHVLEGTANRKVLVIGHRLKKVRLVIPLMVSLCFAIIAAIIAGLLMHNASNGLAAGALLGGCVGIVLTFAIWVLG